MASEVVVALVIMAAATFATRVAGFYLVSLLPPSGRIERYAHIASGSVLAAIIAPALLTADLARAAGIMTAAALMLWLRRPIIAMSAAVFTTIILRI